MAEKKILLPVDITHAHDEVFALLNELLPLTGATVRLLYVREEFPALEHNLRSLGQDEVENTIKERANAVLEKLSAELQEFGATVTHEIAAGPAAMMIERVAKDEHINITVMSQGRKAGAEHYLLGRVSSKVVRHAPGTVLLLRGELSKKMERVLFATDGSPQSLKAIREAVGLFDLASRQIKATVVNVVSVHPLLTMVSPVEYISAIEANLRMSGEAVLAEAEKVLMELGVKDVTMKQLEGNPAEQIMEAAEKCKASLIVLGAQGKGMVEHFLLGATSTRLADRVNLPVAVFKF